ncbi:hypothetical protein EXIGLDRAFT_698487 [Exidia glandulosa HHB12029]|uniref:Uncharacterized protein n=1 Tax=Exidia glandulosa HHB12029 TaxID=1314781 RepID=A0A165E952_EXIGL|nr:hypothetical protein EXIGLDRAFT_698487 [Exidia glandulosa HHB12029]
MTQPGSENQQLTPNSRFRQALAANRQNRTTNIGGSASATTSGDQPDWLDPTLHGEGGSMTTTTSILGRRPREPSPDGTVVLAAPVPGPAPHIDLTRTATILIANPNKRLKSGSESDLLYFARAREAERSLLQYHATLRLLDTQEDLIALNKQWTMSKQLKANINQFTIATLLSPSISSYRTLLVSTVQELLVKDCSLPEGFFRNPARMQIVSRAIQAAATNHRSTIKKKARIDLATSTKWNIRKLASTLTKGTDLKITALMLQRYAFIRFQYVNAPVEDAEAKGKGFWKHVSKKLVEAGDSIPDADEYAMAMKAYLTQDESLYTVGGKKLRLYEKTQLPEFQIHADEAAKDVVLSALEDDDELDGDGLNADNHRDDDDDADDGAGPQDD